MEFAMIFISGIVLFVIIFVVSYSMMNKKEYIEEKLSNLTPDQRIAWMKAYEEAKSIEMGDDVDNYILATSKMDEADKALFLIQMKNSIANRNISTSSTDTPNSQSPTSVWNIGQ